MKLKGKTPLGVLDEAAYRDVFLRSTGKDLQELQDDRFSIEYLPRDLISPDPNQPRKHFDMDALEDLAVSIEGTGGIIQPLIVRRLKGGKYRIIAGERRWRAASLVGLVELPCIVMTGDAASSRIISLVENVQRQDLSPVELARGLRELADQHGLTHHQISLAIGCSRTHVTNLLRLLDLDDVVLEALSRGEIDMGHARALASQDPVVQRKLARVAAENGWTVRRVEQEVARLHDLEPIQSEINPDRERAAVLAGTVGRLLGVRVSVSFIRGGRARLELNSLDTLERLVRILEDCSNSGK